MKRTTFRPQLESLERRTVMAAGLSGGVLTINGTFGDDTVVVSRSGNNVLVTLNSVNSLFPLANVNNVRINGSAGSDTITFTLDKNVVINGGDGNDTITSRGILGGSIAAIFGGTGNDTLTSNDAGRATIRGDGGDDTITCNTTGPADISGGTGNDTITCNDASLANLRGDSGSDTISADNLGQATLRGGTGNDSIQCTASGDVSIRGESGNDTITATTAGRATLDGGSEEDTIVSHGTGTSNLLGGSDNDALTGGFGVNYLDGGSGSDTLRGRGSNNRLRGGADADTFVQEGGPSRLFVDRLDAFTLRAGLDTANYEPILTLSGRTSYVHDQAAILVAPAAIVSDVDSANFASGQLLVRIATGITTANRLRIGGAFTLDANDNVKLGSLVIGKLNANGGIGTNNLIVTFNANATKSIVQSLVRSINFRTINGAAGTRTVQFSLTDGDGGISEQRTRTILVT